LIPFISDFLHFVIASPIFPVIACPALLFLLFSDKDPINIHAKTVQRAIGSGIRAAKFTERSKMDS